MVFEKVVDILVEQMDVEKENITMDSSVMEDLGADSLDVVDIVKSLEEEFNIKVEDSDIEGLKTVGDIVRYIDDKIA